MSESSFRDNLIKFIKNKDVISFEKLYNSQPKVKMHDNDRDLIEEIEFIYDWNIYKEFLNCGLKESFNKNFKIQRLITKGNRDVLYNELEFLKKENYFLDESKLNFLSFDLKENKVNVTFIMECLKIIKEILIHTKKDFFKTNLFFSSFRKKEIFDFLVNKYEITRIELKDFLKNINPGYCEDDMMEVYISMLDYDESFLLKSTLFLICHKNTMFLNELKKRKYLYPLLRHYFINLKEEDIIDSSDLNFTKLFELLDYKAQSAIPFIMGGLNSFFEKERLCYYCKSEMNKENIFISKCRSKYHSSKTNSIFHEKCAKEMGYLCFECEGKEKVNDCMDDLQGKFHNIHF